MACSTVYRPAVISPARSWLPPKNSLTVRSSEFRNTAAVPSCPARTSRTTAVRASAGVSPSSAARACRVYGSITSESYRAMSLRKSSTACSRSSRERSSAASSSRSSLCRCTTRPNRRTSSGLPVRQTVPMASAPTMIGRLMPGLTPRSRRACPAVWVFACRVRSTSWEASCKVPIRLWSPQPMTTACWSVISTLKPVIRPISMAICWASSGVSAGESRSSYMYE